MPWYFASQLKKLKELNTADGTRAAPAPPQRPQPVEVVEVVEVLGLRLSQVLAMSRPSFECAPCAFIVRGASLGRRRFF